MLTQTAAEVSTALPAAPRRRLPRVQELGLVLVIVLISAALGFLAATVRGENGFFRPGNLLPSVFTTMSWIAVMAIGMTVVIITGGIDISVGSVMGLSALGTAAVLQKLPPDAGAKALMLGIAVPIGIGLLCGLINGIIVVGLRMHPFIVTLGTLSIFRGIALISVKEGSLPFGDKSLPAAFTDRFISYPLTIHPISWLRPWNWWVHRPTQFEPVPMILMFAVMIVGWFYLRWTVWGRSTYAVGGNEQAARFSGIRVQWIKLLAYLISGACAGIAGMMNCGFYKSAATNTGLGYELAVVAAAVVGGASLAGGRGTALGAVLGTLIIQLIDNGIAILDQINLGFVHLQVSREYTQIIIGIAIVLAVAVDRFSEYLQSRRAARRGGH